MPKPLVLASASKARAAMLSRAGVKIEIQPAYVDEESVKEAMLAEQTPVRDIADTLADLKARSVALSRPDDFVLGADQILVKDGNIYSKAGSMEEAAAVLKSLSGAEHRLISAAVIYHEGEPVWRAADEAVLTVRPLSSEFIHCYLEQMGETAMETVGCYQLEGLGSQLFTAIKGDFFTILGLPLLSVLDYLRRQKMLVL